MENWRNYLDEGSNDMFGLSFGDKETDKGISVGFDRFLREKHFEAYKVLHNDSKDDPIMGPSGRPLKNLLKKYSNFAIKFKKLDGRFVPPDIWLNDIKKGDQSYYRQWNNRNPTK